MIATRLLIERDVSADEAIAAVRRAQPGAVENTEQEAYLRQLRRGAR
jgi:protein-tyrosine phosphatase